MAATVPIFGNSFLKTVCTGDCDPRNSQYLKRNKKRDLKLHTCTSITCL